MQEGSIPKAQPTGFANQTPTYPNGIDKNTEPPTFITSSTIPEIKGISAFPMALIELLYNSIIAKNG